MGRIFKNSLKEEKRTQTMIHAFYNDFIYSS